MSKGWTARVEIIPAEKPATLSTSEGEIVTGDVRLVLLEPSMRGG